MPRKPRERKPPKGKRFILIFTLGGEMQTLHDIHYALQEIAGVFGDDIEGPARVTEENVLKDYFGKPVGFWKVE